MDTVTIGLESVGRRMGDVWILRDVTFRLGTGEALGVVGPSGSGKSTMLRLIAGLDGPSVGRILLNGRVASEPGKLLPPWERGIGMVFQQPTLWPHMTVEENVAFGLWRWPRLEAHDRVKEVMALVRLTGLERRRPHQLSGGEAQRAALARAIAPRPRILLLDEPLSSLDPELHHSMVELFLEVRRQDNPTVIYVSHNHQEVATVCEQLLVLRGGTVEHHGGFLKNPRPGDDIPVVPAPAGTWCSAKLVSTDRAGVAPCPLAPCVPRRPAHQMNPAVGHRAPPPNRIHFGGVLGRLTQWFR